MEQQERQGEREVVGFGFVGSIDILLDMNGEHHLD